MKTKLTLSPHLVTQAIRALPTVIRLCEKASPRPTEATPNAAYDLDAAQLEAVVALVSQVRKQTEYDCE